MTRSAALEADLLAPAPPPRTITAGDVERFAELTGDHHPQHLDDAWAAESAFGERIAHGLLVLSCAAGQLAFDPARVVALRRVTDVVFKRPVALGESIHTEMVPGEVRPIDDDHALASITLQVRDDGGRLVLRGTLEVVTRRTAPAP